MSESASASVAIIENAPFLGNYFRRLLKEEGIPSDTFPLWGGSPLPARRYPAYIFTGDFHNVTDGLCRYHHLELELLTEIEGSRVFGSCFAHQLIAHARGGKVTRRGDRLLGWELIEVIEPHPGLPAVESFFAFNGNTDEVTEPPGEARWIATSQGCRFQVLAYGEDVLTCQAHPEIDHRRNRLSVAVGGFFLARGSLRECAAFRRSRPPPGDRGSDLFSRSIALWLTRSPQLSNT